MSANQTKSAQLLSHNLKEICFINIAVSIVGCSTLDLYLVFGSRLYNRRSMLYIVHGQTMNFKHCGHRGGRRRIIRFWTRIVLDVVSLYLTPDNVTVEFAISAK